MPKADANKVKEPNNGKEKNKKSRVVKVDSESGETNNKKPLKSHKKSPQNAEKMRNKSEEYDKNKASMKLEHLEKRWYEELGEYTETMSDMVTINENELNALVKLCRESFEIESNRQLKRNPSDAKWLQTTLYKGTIRDRANAGALLVQSNPIPNMKSLEALIGLTKVSNKTSQEILLIVTELFINALLPNYRKLIPIANRGNDWKRLKTDSSLTSEQLTQIYSYWHFETELKDQFHSFLMNLQQATHGNQDFLKNKTIACASRLLIFTPEKEQMLLSMLVNKLGDPSPKVAAKVLHHLQTVVYKHPNMCAVMVKETEKILFRQNISEKAQHFALTFLAVVATHSSSNVAANLIEICFTFFKILIEKGAINNKTMQAILRCIRRAMSNNVQKNVLISKEIQDTMFRLVHLADIQISLQTLGLLLQTLLGQPDKHDRFYNALYKIILDSRLLTISLKWAAFFLHIVHRAVHSDENVERAQAFVKRLLLTSLGFSTPVTCGVLIIVSKLLLARPELRNVKPEKKPEIKLEIEDDDGEEKYADILDETNPGEESKLVTNQVTSWFHAGHIHHENSVHKMKNFDITTYNAYNRVPAFAGAQFALQTELFRYVDHFHPTVKVFAKNIVDGKPIDYYGDPLRDFSIAHFLERFAFKNPRKAKPTDGEEMSLVQRFHQAGKSYKAHGGRAVSVKALTATNCSTDEKFIFDFLERKRLKLNQVKQENADQSDSESVGDDEFEEYLDGLSGKNGIMSKEDIDDGEDYKTEIGKVLKNEVEQMEGGLKGSSKKRGQDDDGDDSDFSYDFDMDDQDVDNSGGSGDDDDDDGNANIFDEDDDSDGASVDFDDGENDLSVEDEESDMDEPKAKKTKKILDSLTGKDFHRKLKNEDDMSSLFAASSDVSKILERSGKTIGHGTTEEVFNGDKASEKQLAWESARRFDSKGRNNFRGRGRGRGLGRNKFSGRK